MRLVAALIVLVTLASPASARPDQEPEPAAGEAVFVVSGRGYGHGVGMGQYGAYGMANAGHDYQEILAHYYTGTELARSTRSDVRILLGEGKRAVTITSSVPFTVVDGTGFVHRVPAGPLVLRSNLVFTSSKGKVDPIPPVLVRPGKGVPLTLDGRQYRGKLEVAPQARLLRVINIAPLEMYLQGVVANEMPHTWPLEALKAQAVGARTYALANLVKGKPYDLYADQRSQVYEGVAGEQPRALEAVRATAHQIVVHQGRIATTYYSSSSGGRTASAEDVFGFEVPYLVSKPDPWDKVSPYHRWGPVLLGARTLQSKLGLDARVLDAAAVVGTSGRARSLTVQTTSGQSKMPAALLRTSLGLRSTWVTIGVLRLDQPSTPAVYGAGVRLTGIARGLAAPVLASSQNGTTWTEVGPLQCETSGVASIVVKPERTLRYRIQVAGAASPPVILRVAPRVTLAQSPDGAALVGTVRPRVSGAPVTIERRQGSGWVDVERTTVDRTGAFRLEPVTPGAYRARVAAFNGFVEALTPVLAVQ